MKAVILAGGRGSRLRPLTDRCPKPMLPLIDRPILAHLLNLLKRHQITEVILSVQYLAGQIQDYFGDGRDFGMSIHYAREERPLGTAGGVKNAQPFLDDETFLVISGDAVTDIDLSRAGQFHRESDALITLVLAEVDDPRQYGVVLTDQSGRIRRYQEKPSAEPPISNNVNTGIYIMEPDVLDMMTRFGAYDFSYDIFPSLLARNAPLFGHFAQGYWRDMGTWQDYRAARTDALAGRVKLADWALANYARSYLDKESFDGCRVAHHHTNIGVSIPDRLGRMASPE
jgi:mannose-1-phosphate guanylyltransferase/phosphomannomutase